MMKRIKKERDPEKPSLSERFNASRFGKRFHKLQKICCFTSLGVTAGWLCMIIAYLNVGNTLVIPFSILMVLFWAVGIVSCILVAPIRTSVLVFPFLFLFGRFDLLVSDGVVAAVAASGLDFGDGSSVFFNGFFIFILCFVFIKWTIRFAIGMAISYFFPAIITISKYNEKISSYDTVIEKKTAPEAISCPCP